MNEINFFKTLQNQFLQGQSKKIYLLENFCTWLPVSSSVANVIQGMTNSFVSKMAKRSDSDVLKFALNRNSIGESFCNAASPRTSHSV